MRLFEAELLELFSITAYLISAILDNLHLAGMLDTIDFHAFRLSCPI